jgi:hypothetical protein
MWKSIPGYENLYEASDDGLIRTVQNKTTSNKKFVKRVWKQRILKYSSRKRHKNNDSFDYMVTLWKNNIPHKYLVARLIAATFCGNNLNTDLTVNHIDGNPLNNHSNNLEWISRADNIRYGYDNGQYTNACKKIKMLSQTGNVLEFDSYVKCDNYLNQYKGYTSRNILLRKDILRSKNGEIYYVRNGVQI